MNEIPIIAIWLGAVLLLSLATIPVFARRTRRGKKGILDKRPPAVL